MQRQSECAFHLVEVVLALLLLSFVSIGLTRSLQLGIQTQAKSTRQKIANRLAHDKVMVLQAKTAPRLSDDGDSVFEQVRVDGMRFLRTTLVHRQHDDSVLITVVVQSGVSSSGNPLARVELSTVLLDRGAVL